MYIPDPLNFAIEPYMADVIEAHLPLLDSSSLNHEILILCCELFKEYTDKNKIDGKFFSYHTLMAENKIAIPYFDKLRTIVSRLDKKHHFRGFLDLSYFNQTDEEIYNSIENNGLHTHDIDEDIIYDKTISTIETCIILSRYIIAELNPPANHFPAYLENIYCKTAIKIQNAIGSSRFERNTLLKRTKSILDFLTEYWWDNDKELFFINFIYNISHEEQWKKEAVSALDVLSILAQIQDYKCFTSHFIDESNEERFLMDEFEVALYNESSQMKRMDIIEAMRRKYYEKKMQGYSSLIKLEEAIRKLSIHLPKEEMNLYKPIILEENEQKNNSKLQSGRIKKENERLIENLKMAKEICKNITDENMHTTAAILTYLEQDNIKDNENDFNKTKQAYYRTKAKQEAVEDIDKIMQEKNVKLDTAIQSLDHKKLSPESLKNVYSVIKGFSNKA